MLEQVQSAGSVDMLGYPITKLFYDSLAGRDLATEFESDAREVLLVQFGGGRGDLRPGYRNHALRWQQAGARVQTEVFAGHETWWFADDSVDKTAPGAQPLLDLTVDWLARRVTARSAS
jgi:hypothetical protein